jgi:hypothetical protein
VTAASLWQGCGAAPEDGWIEFGTIRSFGFGNSSLVGCEGGAVGTGGSPWSVFCLSSSIWRFVRRLRLILGAFATFHCIMNLASSRPSFCLPCCMVLGEDRGMGSWPRYPSEAVSTPSCLTHFPVFFRRQVRGYYRCLEKKNDRRGCLLSHRHGAAPKRSVFSVFT